MDPLNAKWATVKAKVYAAHPKQEQMETHFLEQDITRPDQHYFSLHEEDCLDCYFWICAIMCTKFLVLNWLKKKSKLIYQIFGKKLWIRSLFIWYYYTVNTR